MPNKALTHYHYLLMKAKGGHFTRHCYACIIYMYDDKGIPFAYHLELFYGESLKVSRRNAQAFGMKFTNGRIGLGGFPNTFLRSGITVEKIREIKPGFYVK